MKNNKLWSRILVISVIILMIAVTIGSAYGANEDIIINEFMANPDAVSDANGEYVELYNSGTETVDLEGWTLADEGSDSHTINNGGLLTIAAGEYTVLCKNADFSTNGGVNCDYEYSGITLNNGADEVVLLDTTAYEIDSVAYTSSGTGTSSELISPNANEWALAETTFGDGDYGTPGAVNSVHDGEGPTITNIQQNPEHPQTTDDVEICADVTDDSGVKEVMLNYDNSFDPAGQLMMENVLGDSYCQTLSALTMNPNNGMVVIYSITATDNNDNPTTSDSETYTYDGEDPVAEFTCTPLSGEESLTTTCTSTSSDSVSDPENLDYLWDFGDGETSIEQNPTHEYTTGGDYTVTLTVTDEAGFMDVETKEDYLEVISPPLEISLIKINGQTVQDEDSVEVQPGDSIIVDFSFTNNYEEELGLVEASADVDSSLFEEFPYEAVCTVINCEDGMWRLDAGESGSHSFIFDVPLDAPDTFILTINVEEDGFWGVQFSDSVNLNFEVERDNSGLIITEATIEDLSCGDDQAIVRLSLTNFGEYAITPGVLIYDEEQVLSSFNTETGEFPGIPLVKEELDLIAVGASLTDYPITVDTTNLPQGEHTFYIYVINPHIDGDHEGIADYTAVSFTIDGCIVSVTPDSEDLTLAVGDEQEFTVDVEGLMEVEWTLDNENPEPGYYYNLPTDLIAGTHTLKVEVGTESYTWSIDVLNPVNYVFENNYGKIEFQEDLGDIQGAYNLNDVIKITANQVAIDTKTAPGFDVPAQITLNKKFEDPVVEKSSGFDVGPFSTCTDCDITKNVQGEFVFTVESFSTYKVLETPRCLSITNIEINGDNDGELSLDEATEFEVTVENNCNLDLENVEVTVTILDVDNDDLEETSEDIDLDKGDDETFTIEIDLSSEDVDEEEYVIEFLVEGEDDDHNDYYDEDSMLVEVEIEKHNVIIKETELTTSVLQCGGQSTLYVTVENRGQNDEDDVEIRVKNDLLELDLNRDNLELDKFTDQDNDYRASFGIYVNDVEAGDYPILVEVFRDGNLDDSETVDLTVRNCYTSGSTTQTQDQLTLQEELKEQLQLALQGEQQGQVVASSSFRNNDSYLLLLGFLVLLSFTAIVLALAVGMKKKGKVKIAPAKKVVKKEN